jgi:hypothetical protein
MNLNELCKSKDIDTKRPAKSNLLKVRAGLFFSRSQHLLIKSHEGEPETTPKRVAKIGWSS